MLVQGHRYPDRKQCIRIPAEIRNSLIGKVKACSPLDEAQFRAGDGVVGIRTFYKVLGNILPAGLLHHIQGIGFDCIEGGAALSINHSALSRLLRKSMGSFIVDDIHIISVSVNDPNARHGRATDDFLGADADTCHTNGQVILCLHGANLDGGTVVQSSSVHISRMSIQFLNPIADFFLLQKEHHCAQFPVRDVCLGNSLTLIHQGKFCNFFFSQTYQIFFISG